MPLEIANMSKMVGVWLYKVRAWIQIQFLILIAKTEHELLSDGIKMYFDIAILTHSHNEGNGEVCRGCIGKPRVDSLYIWGPSCIRRVVKLGGTPDNKYT